MGPHAICWGNVWFPSSLVTESASSCLGSLGLQGVKLTLTLPCIYPQQLLLRFSMSCKLRRRWWADGALHQDREPRILWVSVCPSCTALRCYCRGGADQVSQTRFANQDVTAPSLHPARAAVRCLRCGIKIASVLLVSHSSLLRKAGACSSPLPQSHQGTPLGQGHCMVKACTCMGPAELWAVPLGTGCMDLFQFLETGVSRVSWEHFILSLCIWSNIF